ncbi:MAG: DUF3772 domain-containing protein [Sulfitobacter sp.]
MTGPLARCAAAILCVFWLAVAAIAQDATEIDFEQWDSLAERAEASIDRNQISDAVFEALRNEVADFRSIFEVAKAQDAVRVVTLREQIAALGSAPADGDPPEDADVSARRAALMQQLNAALVPVQQAEAAFVHADSLVGQIDGILRARQTDELFKVVPTPLNPVYWHTALTDFVSSLVVLRLEGSEVQNDETGQALREALPIAILLCSFGVLLIFRGRRWSDRIVQQLQKYGARGFSIWRFLVSLLRIILPFAGMLLFAIGVSTSALIGPKGSEIVLTVAVLSGAMLGVRWVSEQIFSRDDDAVLIPLNRTERAQARFCVGGLTFTIVLSELVALVLDAGYPATSSKPVLTFGFLLISSLALFRIGQILRRFQDPVVDDTATPEMRGSTFRRVVRALGTGAIVVACLTPLLVAAGYFNAADALMPPYIMTLVILGLVVALQRFGADVYVVLTRQGPEAREALFPVLFGMALLLAVLPLLALIWGVRPAELFEIWTAFGRGFAIGDSRISPTDFLAFAVIFAIGYVLSRLIQSALRTSVLPKTRIDVGGQNAIVSGVGYVGIFLAALAAITGAGLDLSSLAIVAGALSVGIGFGLQTIVSNFVSGIILLIERPISEGDWIEVGGQMGYVRDISVRSTRIETFDKTDVIVPNADLVSGTVTNYTRGNTVGRVIVPVGVAYGTDTKQVEQILLEIAQAQPMVLANPGPSVLFLNFGADALEFEIRCFLRDVNWMMVVKSNINHAVAERFDAEGIEIPFAQRDVWLRNPEVLHPQGQAVQAGQPDTKKDKA